MAVATNPNQIAAEIPARVRTPRRSSAAAPPPTSPPPVPPEPGLEKGVSGTQNMLGIISGVEYLPALVPPEGLRVYEQMRNTAQVNASLAIVKAPILSSTPIVQMPQHGDPADEGIAAFCQAALFGEGGLLRSSPWRHTFQHLLTRLDFGVAVCEKVWRYDAEAGTWRIAKLSPRLAPTLWEWRQDPKTLELNEVVQQALRPDGSWLPVPIPASKCVVSSYQREGDNYWGRSMLRSAYFHWFALMELLRIGLVRADRWGVGIPVAEFADVNSWQDQRLVTQVKKALKALRSHERAFVLQHPSVKFTMMNLNGTDGGVKLADDVEYHSTMIIQNALATFLTGKADGMSTNRTGELADIFTSMLELVAADVAGDLTDQVVRELCDLNFVMKDREYPSVRFTNIAHTDLDALVGQVTRLVAVGAVTPTPEDETHFRELAKLPPRTDDDVDPKETKRRGDADDDPEAGDVDEDEADDDEALRLKDDGRLLGREATPLEVLLLRQPEAIARSLNFTAQQLETRLAAIRQLQLEKLVAAIVKKDARTSTAAFSDLRPDEFNIPERGLTAKAIRSHQDTAFADGRRRVRQELARQGAAIDLRLTTTAAECRILLEAKKQKAQPAVPTKASQARTSLVTSAKVTAERLNDLWFNRILETATRLRRGGMRGLDLARAVTKALETELLSGLKSTAKAKINESFGLGRAIEQHVQKEEIEKCVYSCLLDVHSCAPCVALDGTETDFGSEVYYDLLPPYKNCDGNKGGGDACRCMWLSLLKGRTV